ncbi:stage II sporulation protein M [Desulforamulus profundi]|uniref:stage II sporulation protein M n=1 Tax=Desulforamulus profundi TaxID=1383067 RepID=UPI001EE629D3|nr:stage II sporulation protein M [Desulforamulus profundi]
MANSFKKMWKSSLRESWPIYLLALVTLTAGICFGNWGAHNLDSGQAGQLSVVLDSFVNQVGTVAVDRSQVVKSTITNNLFFIGLIYFLGLTVIGTPAILALLFARGFSLGFTVGFLTKERAGEGVVIALTSVLPQNILLMPAVFMAGVAALSFSWLLIRRFLNSRNPVLPGLIGYHLLILVVCCIAAAAGLVEAFITPDLIKAAVNILIK